MQIEGVTATVLETWIRRDYGLTSEQLRVVFELRDGKCPPFAGGPVRGITPRDIYLTRVIRLLPEMAKPRCRARAEKYTAKVVQLLWPRVT